MSWRKANKELRKLGVLSIKEFYIKVSKSNFQNKKMPHIKYVNALLLRRTHD